MAEAKKRFLEYKVVETSTVHDEAIEEIINAWVSDGWNYDGMQFAMQATSRRPTLAFILFTRELTDTGNESDS